MVVSWSFIIGLFIFCYSRIFIKGLGGEDPKTLKQSKK
jgi:hypothetical protein